MAIVFAGCKANGGVLINENFADGFEPSYWSQYGSAVLADPPALTFADDVGGRQLVSVPFDVSDVDFFSLYLMYKGGDRAKLTIEVASVLTGDTFVVAGYGDGLLDLPPTEGEWREEWMFFPVVFLHGGGYQFELVVGGSTDDYVRKMRFEGRNFSPEPSAFALLALGAVGAVFLLKKKE